MDCHPQIIDGICSKLEELYNSHSNKVFILEGMFQADSYIQYLLVQKMVDFAVGNNTDFAVVAGESCLQMTKFRLTVKKGMQKLKNITIATSFQSAIQQCREHLGNSGTFKPAESP